MGWDNPVSCFVRPVHWESALQKLHTSKVEKWRWGITISWEHIYLSTPTNYTTLGLWNITKVHNTIIKQEVLSRSVRSIKAIDTSPCHCWLSIQTARDYKHRDMMKSAFRPQTASSLGRALPVREKKGSKEPVLQQSSKHANGTNSTTVGGTTQRTRTHTASGRNNTTGDASIADPVGAGGVSSKQHFGSTVSAGSHKNQELAEVTGSRQSGGGAKSSSRTRKQTNKHAASRDARPAGVNKASSGMEGDDASPHRRRKVSSTNAPSSSATTSSLSLLSATSRRSSSQILADSLKASKTTSSRLYSSLPLLHEDDIIQHRRGQRSLSEGAGVDQPSTDAGEDANTSFASRRSTSHSTVMALAREYELVEQREEEVHNKQIEANLASDSDRALDGGDDDTVQASGNSNNRALALRAKEQPRPKSTTGTAHGRSNTRKAIRVAEIEDNIEIMDKEIEATMRKLRELQENRKVLVAELTAASRENGAGVPIIPEEVSFNQNVGSSSRRKNNTSKGQDSSSSRSTRPTKKDISSWREKESTHSNPALALLSEDGKDEGLVQNQVQPRVA